MGPRNTLLGMADFDESISFQNIIALCERAANGGEDNAKTIEETAEEKTNWLGLTLEKLSELLAVYESQIKKIGSFVHLYDPKGSGGVVTVRANGYRSFVRIGGCFVRLLTEHLVRMTSKAKLMADADMMAGLDIFIECLKKLIELNYYLVQIHEMSVETHPGEMFPREPNIKAANVKSLAEKIATLNLACFYEGRVTGFHFNGDCRRIAQPIILALGSFADIYDGSYLTKFKRVTNAMFGIRYTLNSELLAQKVFNEVREKPVEFVQSFFNMAELDMLYRNKFDVFGGRSAEIRANSIIMIPPERMSVMNTQGAAFQVPVPNSHVGHKNIQVRLISPFRTPDMVGGCPCNVTWPGQSCSCRIVPESDTIFFHLHGGGFVSHTSKSHSPYLKRWAKALGIPILSVDYSLAPEAPYPRAVEETLYAYCWMLQNFRLLGTTGRKIIVGGDSAGGNLSAGLVTQCIEHSLRKPDHLIGFYPSLLSQMYPSPSRLICMVDPLVMFPCLLRCLNAYSDPNYAQSCPRSFMQELESCEAHTEPLLSPLLASKEVIGAFPPCLLVTTNVDPCLDETVAFYNKLIQTGVKVDLQVFDGLPHGFLSLGNMSKDALLATDMITEKLRDIILSFSDY